MHPVPELGPKLGSLVVANSFFRTAHCGRYSPAPGRVRHKGLHVLRFSPDPQCGYRATLGEAHFGRSLASRHTVSILLMMSWRLHWCKGLPPTAARKWFIKYCGGKPSSDGSSGGFHIECGVHNTINGLCSATPLKEHSATVVSAVPQIRRRCPRAPDRVTRCVWQMNPVGGPAENLRGSVRPKPTVVRARLSAAFWQPFPRHPALGHT